MHRRAPALHIDVHIDDGGQLEVGTLHLNFISMLKSMILDAEEFDVTLPATARGR